MEVPIVVPKITHTKKIAVLVIAIIALIIWIIK